ncbi:hypothetical protein N864_05115 [Intrasporangium chromatireducens Q5-1]|uniref:Uncharacterized protein n=1 Tax=Intrasporangium chromatireducens Q5-1 TaxID=584657 RepID=W9GN97_9MICO|nr:hypothetical protein N864_05115 [Intrasporangium chromatireducens Q5-1]
MASLLRWCQLERRGAARQPKVHRDESRTQGLHRLELIRFLQVAQTITVHHGALAYPAGAPTVRSVPEVEHRTRVRIVVLELVPQPDAFFLRKGKAQ